MIVFGVDLPAGEVFVVYENGDKKSVAFQDRFDRKDAEYFKSKWESRGKIKAVEHHFMGAKRIFKFEE